MDEFKPVICITCFNVKCDENWRVIDESIKNAIDILLLKLPIEETAISMICNACYLKMFEAFQFKTTCMDIEHSIIAYLNLKNGVPVDLKEIYLEERSKKQIRSVLENERICRLCMQITISGFTSIKDIETDLIRIYIPEVDFNSTEDPVVCAACLESLKTHSGFLRNCLSVQKFENANEETESQFNIITEKIEIKSEDSDENIETPLWANESKFQNKEDSNVQPQTKAQKYQCDSCKFRTNYRSNLMRHQVMHKGTSEIRMYRCDMCNYESRHKDSLSRHRVVHTDIAQAQMFKCGTCNFETKRKGSLATHELRHKDTSEAQLYKCDTCNYKTSRRDHFMDHQLKHKSFSEVQMYKCDICSYETKYKRTLACHQRNHKDVSQVQMYKCDKCSFETRHKENLKSHGLTHKDISEVQMYKCDKCSYETRHKGCLASHQVVHKPISEMQMYKCGLCNYEAKRKGQLKSHQLKHKTSEVQMYKCDLCNFETKHKQSFTSHRTKHQNISHA